MTADMDPIGAKIKDLRLSLGMTLEEVGDAVGVGKSTVRKWENGNIANMGRDKIVKLAKVLHTTPSTLDTVHPIILHFEIDISVARKRKRR